MKAHLKLRQLYIDGSSSRLIRLTEISAGRDSGVPQMVAGGSNFLLAWKGEAPDHGALAPPVPERPHTLRGDLLP